MATSITPPLPTAPLQRGVYNVFHKLVAEATGATLGIARSRAKDRGERAFLNVKTAMQALQTSFPPGTTIRIGPVVIDSGKRVSQTTGLVAYVRAKYTIRFNVSYARR